MTPEQLMEKYGGYWGEHPIYTHGDWRHEVANGSTLAGYWQWVCDQFAAEATEPS
jgi:hypothetical protein